MSERSQVRLDQLATAMQSGFACGKSNLVEQGLLHLRPFNIGRNGEIDLTQEYRVPSEAAPRSNASLHAGDILFNNTNSPDLVGKTAVVRENLNAGFSNHVTRIRLDSARCDPMFVAAYLRRLWMQGHFRDHCTQWVSQAAYGTRLLARLYIPLPPLEEQRRIVDILDRTARIETLRAQAAERLQEFVSALFVKMFGDPATNPMGWEVVRLGQLCDMDRQGIQPTDSVAAQLHFVGVENVISGTGILNFATDSRVGRQKSMAFRFDERHVLYGKLRPYLNKVATPGFAGRCSTELVPLLPRDGVNRYFLAHLLRHKDTVEFIMASVTGTRMPRTDMRVLMSMPAPLPPLDKQRRFAGIVNQVSCMTIAIQTASNASSVLSASLMSRFLGNEA